jgi:lipoprotein-anchoring transpeptidase ErfK/SrfK
MQNYDDISPFPKGSQYYYNPTHINYGMVYSDYGYIVHDAWWRSWFGKYSNLPHYDPISFNNGSHGCVNVPLSDMAWLFQWASYGTPVLVY